VLKNEGEKLRKVIVSSPEREYFGLTPEETELHHIAEPPIPEKAKLQHDLLKMILADSGCKVIDLSELSGHPNSVFTRDTTVVTPNGFIELRMGLPTRRGEERWMKEALTWLGLDQAGRIEEPGTVEGGDVILAGEAAFVGRSSRTNDEGIEQLTPLLERMGYEVRTARVPEPYLHLGGAMSMVGPKLVLCDLGIFEKEFFSGYETLSVPGGTFSGANVICLGNMDVIACSSQMPALSVLLGHGVRVHSTDLSEFIKGSGGPSCLIMPVERGGL
jgi:dimethylargininase